MVARFVFRIAAKTSIYIVLSLVVLVPIAFGVSWAAWQLFLSTGIDLSPFGPFVPILIGYAMYLGATHLRLERPFEVVTQGMIDAPVEQVWDEVLLRARSDYYLPSVAQVRAVSGQPDLFEFQSKAPPIEGESDAVTYTQRLIACEPLRYLHYRLENSERLGGCGRDILGAKYYFERRGAKTHYRTVEGFSALTFDYLWMRFLVHPGKDSLGALQARCERRVDHSWNGLATRWLDNGKDLAVFGVWVMCLTAAIVIASIWLATPYAIQVASAAG